MKIVTDATHPPGMCLASRDADGPFFDTGLYARHVDPYIYISCHFVKERAKDLGMVESEEVDALRERFEAQAEEIARLKRFVEAHQVFEAAVDGLREDEVQIEPAAFAGIE